MDKSHFLKFATGAAAAVLMAVGSAAASQEPAAITLDVTERPNIVLLMTDDQDVASMPVMRNVLAQPHGSWVNFSNAYVSSAICSPSRATLLTGQYASNHGVLGNNWGAEMDDSNTLPVWLDDAGYRTALVGKYIHSYDEVYDPGGNGLVAGWDYFLNIEESVDAHTAMAVDFINSAGDEPFFLWLAYRAPHMPAEPPERYATADVYVPADSPNFNEPDVSDKSAWLRAINPLRQSTIDDLRAERLNHQRELLALDDSFQTIIDTLVAGGHLDDTLIIFTSDNGFSWGSHRLYKKQCAFQECSAVPLTIRYPGATGNRVETRAVSNVDLAATIAEYAGVTPGLPQDGRSLIPLLAGPQAAWDEAVFLEKPHGSLQYDGLVTGGWKYLEYINTNETELYDLVNDPYELVNVSGRAAHTTREASMAAQLAAIRDGKPPPPPPTVTPTPTPTPTSPPPPPPAGEGTLLVSSSTAVMINGVRYADEDILAYDQTAGSWSLYFDGSDVGLRRADIDAFTLLDDGSLLVSVDRTTSVPGLGSVADADLIRFTPTSLGATTAGTFAWYMDGSDLGLSGSAADIDGVMMTAEGDLLISTVGNAKINGTAYRDEDVLRVRLSQTGTNSAGTVRLAWAAAGAGLGARSEDIDALALHPQTGDWLLSTVGVFAAGPLSGGAGDLFPCTPQGGALPLTCELGAALFWQAAAHGMGTENIDGLHLVAP